MGCRAPANAAYGAAGGCFSHYEFRSQGWVCAEMTPSLCASEQTSLFDRGGGINMYQGWEKAVGSTALAVGSFSSVSRPLIARAGAFFMIFSLPSSRGEVLLLYVFGVASRGCE